MGTICIITFKQFIPPIARSFAVTFDQQLRQISSRLAAALGVPTIMSNKVSFATSTTSLPGLPLVRIRWQFRGLSSICDADGTMLSSLEDREGVVLAEVELDPGRKKPAPIGEGYWSFPPARMARTVGLLLRGFELAGQLSYGLSRTRKRMASSTFR